MAIFRQNIVKYITDRPGQVVYRQELADELDLEPGQVSAAILYVQKESPIGGEIETVLRANAWRYVPRRPVVSNNGTGPEPDTSLPVVTLIRQYLIAHPHTPVSVSDLVEYTGRRPDQVKVGVNNMRQLQANRNFAPHVITVIPGQMWRFDPPPGWQPYGPPTSPPSYVTRPTVPTPAAPVVLPEPTTVPAVATVSEPSSSSDLRMFEEVGTAGEAIIIRDGDGNMYRAVPLT